jgi:aminopeptidase N
MSVAEITRAETRMRAELISVQRYDVELDVSHGDAVFGSSTTIRFGCRIPGSSTHADLLAEPDGIEELTLNGRRLDPAEHFADGRITLPGLVADNTLTVVAKLAYETPGFHRSTDPADGKVYTYTKFEPDHARRVFACFEQPDLKAPFAISVIAPASWTVISTQPTPEPEPTDDPAHRSPKPWIRTPTRSSRSPAPDSTTSPRCSTWTSRSPSTTSSSCRTTRPAPPSIRPR